MVQIGPLRCPSGVSQSVGSSLRRGRVDRPSHLTGSIAPTLFYARSTEVTSVALPPLTPEQRAAALEKAAAARRARAEVKNRLKYSQGSLGDVIKEGQAERGRSAR